MPVKAPHITTERCGSGYIERRMRRLITLTWDEDGVKSWHSKSTQRAENTVMAPRSPSHTRVYADKVKSPGSRSSVTSPPASATEPSFTSRRAAPEWLSLWFQINPSLQPKGLNSIYRTAHKDEGGEEEWDW